MHRSGYFAAKGWRWCGGRAKQSAGGAPLSSVSHAPHRCRGRNDRRSTALQSNPGRSTDTAHRAAGRARMRESQPRSAVS
ncbi:hypothetical protein [Azospirillum doebereinerae]